MHRGRRTCSLHIKGVEINLINLRFMLKENSIKRGSLIKIGVRCWKKISLMLVGVSEKKCCKKSL